MSKHTPLPWAISEENSGGGLNIVSKKRRVAHTARSYDPKNQDEIPDAEAIANAEYIVHCVNTHQALVDALEEITSRFERLETLYFTATNQTPDCENGSVKRAREALKNARGGGND